MGIVGSWRRVKELYMYLGRKLTETDRSEDFVAVGSPWGFMVKWIGRLSCLDRFRVCLWWCVCPTVE